MTKKLAIFQLFALILFSVNATGNTVDVLIQQTCKGKVPSEIVKLVVTHESKTYYNDRAQPWPWTLNIEGVGYYYKSKDSAVVAAKKAIANGVKKLGIGLGQIEWRFHGQRFGWDVERALNPVNNIKSVCAVLQEGMDTDRVKNWADAIAYYHRPKLDKIGREYASKVLGL
jgi:hypothetical protein